MDDSIGPTDMPSVWNLQKYHPEAESHDFAGDSHESAFSDYGFGVGAVNASLTKSSLLGQVDWLLEYLGKLPAPKYPFAIDPARV